MTEPVEWFVQMSLGPQLGPMSRGDLEELTRSGAVLRSDKVRQGENGHWRLASELRGMFDSEPEPSAKTGPEKTDSDTNSEPEVVAVPPPQEEPEQPKPVEDSAADRSEGDMTEASPEISEEAAELDALLPSPQESSREIDEEDFELNLPRPLSSVEPAPPEVTEPVDSDSETSPPDEEPAVEEPVPPEPLSPLSMPPPLPPETMPKPLTGFAAATPIPLLPETRSPQQRPARRLPWWLPRAGGLTVILIGVVLAFPLLAPDPDPKIYSQFSSLDSEWLQHRLSVATDPWPEFAERAKAELDESLPWLEEHTEPGDRRRSLPLFAGRRWIRHRDRPRRVNVDSKGCSSSSTRFTHRTMTDSGLGSASSRVRSTGCSKTR